MIMKECQADNHWCETYDGDCVCETCECITNDSNGS